MPGLLKSALVVLVVSSAADNVRVSNVVPRRDTAGNIVNAHAGGIYNFSGTF